MNSAGSPPLYVVITVDVESSDSPAALDRGDLLEAMVYGKIDGVRWGFPKIIEVLARYDHRATFFLSALQYKKSGEGVFQEVCGEIGRGGHDIQLHVHPAWAGGQRYMADCSLDEQTDIIGEGAEKLTKWTGRKPVAYRGGAYYSLNEDTFRALRAGGLAVDATMYYGQPRCKYVTTHNRVVEVDGIIELPVTICRLRPEIPVGPIKYKRRPHYVKTDINAVGLDVLLRFVQEARENNLRVMNLFLHSYSFLSCSPSYTNFKPEPKQLEKLDRFLAAVAADPGIEVVTVAQFYELYRRHPATFTGASDHVPEITASLGALSSLRQGWRRLKAAGRSF
jgi:peptidoglycan/xylan/chitin deacetylase (PgdA/CDA1 family)